MTRKILLMVMVAVFVISGSLMLSSCAQEEMKKTPEMTAAEKAKAEEAKKMAAEKARMEREKAAREAALRESRLREEQEKAKKMRDEFENTKIYFAFDSAVLSDEAQSVLRDKAGYLTKNQDKKVLIEGHCDERGSVEYNLALGQRRAESAMKYLVLLGVGSDRIRTISYGKERPVDPGHNEAAWAKNRRCEFILE